MVLIIVTRLLVSIEAAHNMKPKAKKNKHYSVDVYFTATTIKVSATGTREARKKIKERLEKTKALKYVENNNIFVSEI